MKKESGQNLGVLPVYIGGDRKQQCMNSTHSKIETGQLMFKSLVTVHEILN